MLIRLKFKALDSVTVEASAEVSACRNGDIEYERGSLQIVRDDKLIPMADLEREDMSFVTKWLDKEVEFINEEQNKLEPGRDPLL